MGAAGPDRGTAGPDGAGPDVDGRGDPARSDPVSSAAGAVRRRRPLRRWGLRVGVLATAVVAAAVLGRWVVHGPVDAESLWESVYAEAGTMHVIGPQRCRRAADDEWSCGVWDGAVSGNVSYRVRLRPGSSCWDARIPGRPAISLSRTLDGCVHRWQWSVEDAVGLR